MSPFLRLCRRPGFLSGMFPGVLSGFFSRAFGFVLCRVVWLVLLIPSSLWSQVPEGFDLDTLEGLETTESELESGSNFQKYFFGDIGIAGGRATGISRQLVVANVGVDIPLGTQFRFFSDVGYVHYDNSYDLVLREEAFIRSSDEEEGGLPETLRLEARDSYFQVNDLYGQWRPLGGLLVRAGRQRVVLGQFDRYSPVDFFLPQTQVVTSLVPNKVETRYPQDALNVIWYPTSRLELQYVTHYNGVRIDPVVESTSDEFLVYGDPVRDDDGGLDYETRSAPVSNEDARLDIYRAVFYGSGFTFGATYVEGNAVFFPTPDGRLTRATDLETPGGQPVFRLQDVLAGYPSLKGYGLELAVPAGSWTWKAEYAHFDTENAFDFDPERARPIENDFGENFGDSGRDDDRAAYQQVGRQIIERFDGRLRHGFYVDVAAAGGEYRGEKWIWDLSVIALRFRDEAGASEINDRIAELENDEFPDTFIVPFFNVGRYIDAKNEHLVGVGVGSLIVAFGGGVYYAGQVSESLRLGVIGGALEFNDDLAEIENYEPKEEFPLYIYGTLQWLF